MKLRVLIVDDTRTSQYLHRTLLEDQGYEVSVATTGEEALEKVEVFEPDLVLMDVVMPGIDGIECCRRIRKLPNVEDLKIMMVTAATGYNRISEAFTAGCDDYITKPIDEIELLQKAKDLLKFVEIKKMLRDK